MAIPQLPQNLIQLRQDPIAIPLQCGDLAVVLGVTSMEPPTPAC